MPTPSVIPVPLLFVAAVVALTILVDLLVFKLRTTFRDQDLTPPD